MSDKSSERSFLERWSKRKRQAETVLPVTLHDARARTSRPADEDALCSSTTGSRTSLPEPLPVSLPIGTDAPVSALDQTDAVTETTASEPAGTRLERAEKKGANPGAPILTDDDMPAIESLSSQSDLSVFFNKGVSAALRKAALRHVFQQPQYNVRDGLNDYDGNYTVFEPLGDTVTSDMKWHIARKERARLEAEARELEEQERLLAEQQASDGEQLAGDTTDEHRENGEDGLEPEQDISTVKADGQYVSESGVPTGDYEEVLLASAGTLVDKKHKNGKSVGRLDGKLRRKASTPLDRDNGVLQIADTATGDNVDAQEKPE